jgi:acyl-coenzyme A thioesterase PaaI-like protein
MAGGRAILSMEAKPEPLDAAGSHHAGALAALLDSRARWRLGLVRSDCTRR